MISRFFIDRPIFAAVISIIITLAGLVAMVGLPIAQFPEITPPLLQVTTSYPGADADTTSNSVAAPVEQQVRLLRSAARLVSYRDKICRKRVMFRAQLFGSISKHYVKKATK